MVATSGALARVVVLAGHRCDETMEASLARELRMEGGRHDIALADRNDPAVVEPGKDVDVRAGSRDDGRSDEHAMDGLIAEDGNGQIGFE